MNHIFLLSEIRRLKPTYLILDTSISKSQDVIIELREENSANAVNAVSSSTNRNVLVGYPSRKALELMLRNSGFDYAYYDWHNVGIENWENIEDYHKGERVSLIATSTQISCLKK